MSDERKCYRVEGRTIVPGKKVLQGSAPGSNLPVEAEKNDLFIVIEGRSEQFIDRFGNKIESQTDILINNYFDTTDEAAKTAEDLHRQNRC